MTTDVEPRYSLYASVLLWCTSRFEYAGFLVSELKEPTKNFPRLMPICVMLMVLTYLLPISTAIAIAPPGFIITEGTLPTLAQYVLGNWMSYVFVAGGLISSLGTFNAYLHTSSTALHSLALNGGLPKILLVLTPRFNTPIVCIGFYCCTTAVLIIFDFSVIVEVEALLYSSHIILFCVAFLSLKLRSPHLPRPFKVPGGKIGGWIIVILPCIVMSTVWGFALLKNLTIAVSFIVFGIFAFLAKECVRSR